MVLILNLPIKPKQGAYAWYLVKNKITRRRRGHRAMSSLPLDLSIAPASRMPAAHANRIAGYRPQKLLRQAHIPGLGMSPHKWQAEALPHRLQSSGCGHRGQAGGGARHPHVLRQVGHHHGNPLTLDEALGLQPGTQARGTKTESAS